MSTVPLVMRMKDKGSSDAVAKPGQGQGHNNEDSVSRKISPGPHSNPRPPKKELCLDSTPLGSGCEGFQVLAFILQSSFPIKWLMQLSQLKNLVPIMLLSDLFKICFVIVFQGNLITRQKGNALLGSNCNS